jgi:hypothetical protein
MRGQGRWLLVLGAAVAGWSCSSTEAVRPASLSITSGDGQTAPAGNALAPFVVTVTGSDGRPFRGATVTWQITGGTGSLNPTSSVTDSVGEAHTVLTLPGAFGLVTVEAAVAGIAAQTFSATAVDPCDFTTAHTFGGSSSGVLSYVDYFEFTVGAQGIRVDMSASFDTYLLLYDGSGAFIGADDDGGAGTNSLVRAILPSGTYQIGANSYAGGVTGSYSLTTSTISSSATGCVEYWVVRGLQSTQGLGASDCASSGSYGDVFSIALLSGQSITVTQASAAFDAYLGLVNANNVVVASDNDSGPGTDAQFTYTASVSGVYYLVATSWTTGATGTYTLTIQ